MKESNQGQNGSSQKDEVKEIRDNIKIKNFQKLVYLAGKDFSNQVFHNREQLRDLFESVKGKFESALNVPEDSEEQRDKIVYRSDEL